MATLKEDIITQAEWITKAFSADNFKLDYTIDSFIEIDRFFNKHSKDGKLIKGGRLTSNLGLIVFSLGSYLGETIIKTVPGSEWITDDNDPKGEMTASIKLPNGIEMWPMQRIMKRYQNGNEDAVYTYGHMITKEITKLPFNESFWTLTEDTEEPTKPWWKFW